VILLDTNILARTIQTGHPHHQPARDAMTLLRTGPKEQFAVSPQVLLELYAICTRTHNGLGLTPQEALSEIAAIKNVYPVLPETPAIFPTLESLLAKYRPTNRRVFDARHVAVMLAHGLSKILTFNDADFLHFSEIQPLNPFDILNLPRR
jgi:predicted nucleic acid-binding protein